MHPNVARVVAAADAASLEITVERFPEGTRTAADAARAVGCDVGQIVKSLVFLADDAPVVALVSGANRADLGLLAAVTGTTEVRKADGGEARDATGYAIGGVPPFAYSGTVRVVVDRDLLAHEVVWAAAGLPDAIFAISPTNLVRVSGGTVATIAEAS